jgi:type 2 lantibiotic biosynthesis protein LanM
VLVQTETMSAVDASWNGATLIERLAHVQGDAGSTAARAAITSSSSSPNDVLAPWARACAFGNLDALFRRLSWDGITPEAARAAMAAEAPANFPVAAWVGGSAELVAEARASARLIGTPEWDADLADVGSQLPFVDAWLPVLRVTRRRIAQVVPACRDWLSDESIRALEVHLLRELSRLGELALIEDFRAHADTDTESDRYESYIHRLLASRYADVLGTFPVLTRHVVLLAEQWVQQIGTLVSRLQEDRAAIAATFGADAGQVRRLTPGLSDRHGGGCRVAAVEFASGLRLAYKPRDVRLERRFNECLMWLRQSGLDVVPRPLRVIDRGTHGWVEWAEQEDLGSSEAVHAYFRSAGALVCLAHVLGGRDLHSENVVASSHGPMLVDVEMLLQPSTRPLAEASSDEDAIGESFESCLASGLVSFIGVDKSGTTFDVGGLQPATAREVNVPLRRWLDLRRNDIRFVPEHRVHPVLRNDVRLNGDVQRPEDFVADLCAGFESTYRFLESSRASLLTADGPLSGFADCRIRLLFRPSDEYAAAQYVLAAPRYQRCGLDRSLGIEMFARVFASEVERPRLWLLVHDGRPALESLDIPRPTMPASATDLETPTGEAVQPLYAQSGIEAVRRRLSALSAEDLAYQIDQLRTALGATEAASLAPPHREATEDALCAGAERIGLALLGRAHQGLDASLRWPSAKGRVDLYSGASGIGLFLAALAAATKRETWYDAARRAWQGIDADTRGTLDSSAWRIGICSGRPSVAYAMALSGHLLEDERLIARAGELASTVPFDAIDNDVTLDIEGGAAGALVACLAVDEMSAHPRLIELAGRCVSRLLATQIPTGSDRGAWPSGDEGRSRPGFAHGAAGIAYALCRWAARTEDLSVNDAVRGAWAFERRLFADSSGAWPAVRRDGSRLVMAAWCHGAPGIALARALGPEVFGDSQIGVEIDVAMRLTLSAPETRLDHLCCGNLGRADVALSVGLQTGTRTWIDEGVTMARTVAARILRQGRLGMRGRGTHWGAPAPELFQGLAGIGYQLLRASSPVTLPSVLAFEVPSVTERRITRENNR